MIEVGTEIEFHTPYQYGPTGWTDEEFAARQGTMCEIVAHITEACEGIDAEVLPMYRVRFVSDGVEIDAWPEEVE